MWTNCPLIGLKHEKTDMSIHRHGRQGNNSRAKGYAAIVPSVNDAPPDGFKIGGAIAPARLERVGCFPCCYGDLDETSAVSRAMLGLILQARPCMHEAARGQAHFGRRGPGPVEHGAQAEPIGPGPGVAFHRSRRDAAHGQQNSACRQHGAQRLDGGGWDHLRGEEFENRCAAIAGGKGLGRGSNPRAIGHAVPQCFGPNTWVKVRRHDQPAASGMDLLCLGNRQDRAGSDDRVGAETRRELLDTVQGIRRVQRHFDDREAFLQQGTHHRHGIGGGDPPQDRDQRAATDCVIPRFHANTFQDIIR